MNESGVMLVQPRAGRDGEAFGASTDAAVAVGERDVVVARRRLWRYHDADRGRVVEVT